MTRLLIIEETRFTASILAAALTVQPGISVVGETQRIDAALDVDEPYDVALVSAGFPEQRVIEFIDDARSRRDGVTVIVRGTGENGEPDRYLRAGAAEVIPEDTPLTVLAATLRSAANETRHQA